MQNRIEYFNKCFKRIVKKLSNSDISFTVTTVVSEFKKQSFGTSLFPYMESMIEKLRSRGQYRTSETYQSALNSFKKFSCGIDLNLDEIDSQMLISYEYYLRAEGLTLNTISF